MKKTIPKPSIRNRREYLQEMARRGTEHEAAVAKVKLQRLEARYDFGAKHPDDPSDVFTAWGNPKKAKTTSDLISVAREWRDVGNMVKWLFHDKFGLSASWQETPDGASIRIAIAERDLRRIRPLAQSLYNGIIAICREFFCNAPTGELDRAPFLTGLYEGLMNEARKDGGIAPGRSPVPKKKLRRTRKPPAHKTTALHPYDLGREVGSRLRVNVPAETLCEEIRQGISGEIAGGDPDVAE